MSDDNTSKAIADILSKVRNGSLDLKTAEKKIRDLITQAEGAATLKAEAAQRMVGGAGGCHY